MSNSANDLVTVDVHYHQHTGNSIARRVSAIARRRVHELFVRMMNPKPGDKILDIGVSDDTGPDSNMLEQLYPYRHNLTCASLTDGEAIRAAYPGVCHVRIVAGQPLPFADNSFDIVFSNAVLEHAGPLEQQKKFLEEICRISSRRFVAVPNRGFPVEHHTGLPLIHWLPKRWFRTLLRDTRYDFWSREENLNYISVKDFKRIWPDKNPPKIFRTGIGIGVTKSNLVICQP